MRVMIHFECPTCSKRLQAASSQAGVTVLCPGCRTKVRVPGPDGAPEYEPKEVIAVQRRPGVPIGPCPGCGRQLDVPAESLGRWVQCPFCKSEFTATGSDGRQSASACPAGDHYRYDDFSEPGAGDAGPKPNRILAGLFAIFLGVFGVHKFYMGYTGAGISMLLLTLFGTPLLGAGPLASMAVGLVEGILYLTKSDEDFSRTYVLNKRAWF